MKTQHIQYSLGFLFTDNKKEVLLIQKRKPQWQAGLLNGVGGRVEEGESPLVAMVREFKEEAGLNILTWHQFCTMNFEKCSVVCFKAELPVRMKPKSMTRELIQWCSVAGLVHAPTIPNIPWLVHLALDETVIKAAVLGK